MRLPLLPTRWLLDLWKLFHPKVGISLRAILALSQAADRPNLSAVFKELSILDRLLTPLIILAMIVGVLIGEFRPNEIQTAFDTAQFDGVSARK